jgi:hypothetical protein
MGRSYGHLHQMKPRVYGGTNDISAVSSQARGTESCNGETRNQSIYCIIIAPSYGCTST